MEKRFTDVVIARGAPTDCRRRLSGIPAILGTVLAFSLVAGIPAAAQEQILFTAKDNAQSALLQRIKNEQVRIDIAMWLLTDRELTQAIVNRHLAGIPVRVIGDRAGIFESSELTQREFEFLASKGVPIRLRYNPTWFPEIIHWKTAIFVGQNTVKFGSANWTTFQLKPYSTTDFNDETVMFTNDSSIVNAFLTKFDQYWVDTDKFLDWPAAYQQETGQVWTTPMTISRARLEPDYATNIPGMVWSQGSELNNALIAEINRETQGIDMVSYRMTVPNVTDALIARHRAGVPVRVLIEPTQYRNPGFPEYWLVGATTDRLYVAGVPVKQRKHTGLTHMKTLITSSVAMNGSANFTKNWERDHNYFISATSKPSLYLAMKDQFEAMWNDTVNYTDFQPQRSDYARLAAPANGAVNVQTPVRLEWNRTPWAVAFDVYLGTSSGNMAFVSRVNAVITENPPATYSYTPSTLQPNTTYYWKVVSRTYATEVDPSLVNSSVTRSFTTAGSGGAGSAPYGGTAVTLPGTIQAENFDEGGANLAYYDTTTGNSGGAYRSTNVDIEATSDTGGGYNVGWIKASEWLKYSVNVGTAGTYTLEVRVATPTGGAKFHIEANGVDKTGPLTVPTTGGHQVWTTITKTGVSLSAGPQVWTVVFDTPNASGGVGNLNYIRVTAGGTPPSGGSTPYGGTAAALPGTLQVENFDEGGRNVAYADTTTGNSGGQYRTTDVDIERTADTGGGYNVGWIKTGEWLKYSVTVAAAGTYTLEFRVAASTGGGTFHLEVNGVDKTGPLTLPTTGGSQVWTTLTKAGVSLGGGAQVWRLVVDSLNPNGGFGNLNYIRVTTGGTSSSTPFAGTLLALPGTIQAENFDNGGAGVAYYDLSAANQGGQYRDTGVDIAAAADTGGGYTLGWVGAGEWLRYTVQVATAGTYDLEVRVASAGAGGRFHIEVNGVDTTGPLTVPNTGGWQTWSTLRTAGISLSAGAQVWRVVMDTNGATGAVGNFNWFRIS